MTTTGPAKNRTPERPHGWGYYPPTFGVLVYCVPLLVPDLPWWVAPVVGLAVALFGSMAAGARFPAAVYGQDFHSGVRLCVALAGIATGTWLLGAYLAGGPFGHAFGAPLWQLLVVGLIVFGSWWAALMWRAPAYAESIDAQRGPGPAPLQLEAAAPADPLAAEYVGAFQRALIEGVNIDRVETSSSGAVETLFVSPQRAAPGRKSVTFDVFKQRMGDLTLELSRTFEEARGIEGLESADVLPEYVVAHRWKVHVTVKKEYGKQIPYELRTQPRPWSDAVRLGWYQDDRRILMSLCPDEQGASHLTILGMSGAGKGNLINNLVAELIASDEGEVWLADASEKYIQLVYKWLIPWIEGKTDRPVIDRVAGESQTEILQMLADALHYATLCNQQLGRLPVRAYGRGKAALTVILDESSDILENKQKTTLWDGRVMTASQIWSALKQKARTAPVNCVDASQYALFQAAGTAGPKQKRNTGAGICGKLRRRGDTGSVMPGIPAHVDPTKLPKHEFFFQPDSPEDEARALRGRPAAMYREEHIVPVAIAYTQWRTGLDPKLTKQLVHYAGRWEAARNPELVAQAREEGFSWPGSSLPPAAAATPDEGNDSTPEAAAPPAVDDSAPEAPVASVTPLPAHTEETPVPAPDDLPELPDLPAGTLPDEFHRDGFDVWAYFLTEGGPQQPSGGGSSILDGLPDTSGIERAVAKYNAAQRARAGVGIPDPLGRVLRALSDPEAPKDWVTTEALAGVLGYYPVGADEVTKRREVEKLGKEINQQTGLTSEDLPRPVLRRLMPKGSTEEPKRRKGWQVAKLREAGLRIAKQQQEQKDGGDAATS